MQLAEKVISDSGAKMGRPPLNRDDETKTTLVRLEASVMARLDKLAGPNRRGAAIREAVEEWLSKRET